MMGSRILNMYKSLGQAALGVIFAGLIFVFLGGKLFSWMTDSSYWEGVHYTASMILGIGGLCLLALGIGGLNKATERWEYIDNDIGSVEKSWESRCLEGLEGFTFALVGTGMLTILVKFLC